MRFKNYKISVVFITLLLGCAEERAIDRVIPNSNRVPRKVFEQGNFLLLKTVIKNEGPCQTDPMPEGLFLEHSKEIKFVFSENRLEAHSIHPIWSKDLKSRQNPVLFSIPVEYVDILRKRNIEGKDTYEEEENNTRRTWNLREFVKLNLPQDSSENKIKGILSRHLSEPFTLNAKQDQFTFTIKYQLENETSMEVKYFFKHYVPSKNFIKRPYSEEAQSRLGVFKTEVPLIKKTSGPGSVELDQTETWLHRRNPNQPTVYYFSKNFPNAYKALVHSSFRKWNEALREETGRVLLDGPRENTGQEQGDLNYNLVVYSENQYHCNSLVGYGPIFSDPNTGEILKADIVLYAYNLQRQLYNADILLNQKKTNPIRINQYLKNPLLGNAMESVPWHQGNIPLVSALGDNWEKESWYQGFIQENQSELKTLSTPLSQSILISNLIPHKETSLDTIFQRILENVSLHELGHNLGLRHNFMGSAEEAENKIGSTSSIMDYSTLNETEACQLGTYDKSVIRFLYGSESLPSKPLAYCTDEHLFQSKYGYCQVFDSGSKLSEIASSYIDQYRDSYVLRNFKLDRWNFGESPDRYRRQVAEWLLPLRQILDHAQAVLDSVKQNDGYMGLWQLVGSKIESSAQADKTTPGITKLQITQGLYWNSKKHQLEQRRQTVYINQNKVKNIVEDANKTKNQIINAFQEIILNSEHLNYDYEQKMNGDILIRGHLFDKLLSLRLFTDKRTHPIYPGVPSIPFMNTASGIARFFTHLIAGVREIQLDETRFIPFNYDRNLRELAVHLLATSLPNETKSFYSKSFIEVQKYNINTKSIGEYRKYLEISNSMLSEALDSINRHIDRNLTLDNFWKAIYQIPQIFLLPNNAKLAEILSSQKNPPFPLNYLLEIEGRKNIAAVHLAATLLKRIEFNLNRYFEIYLDLIKKMQGWYILASENLVLFAPQGKNSATSNASFLTMLFQVQFREDYLLALKIIENKMNQPGFLIQYPHFSMTQDKLQEVRAILEAETAQEKMFLLKMASLFE